MMNKFTNDLQKFTFDQLADRVAMKVDYLSHIYNSDTIWKDILDSCQMVEKEPRNISSVIVKAKKEDTLVVNGLSIKKYHTILTRIYILLYYCHYDEDAFKILVFPQLVNNMGIYAGDSILKNKIQKEIGEIISQDEMIEKALEEKKRKNQDPKFSIPKLTQPELDELFENYNDEKLFREFIEFYEEILQTNGINLDHARLWYVAKDIVKKLWVVNHPESYIERILRQFAQEKNSIGSAEPQYIMMCVYAIMRSIKGNHFEMATKRIENLADPNKEYYYLQDHMDDVKRWIQETNPFDDYNYVRELPKQELFSSADIEQITNQYLSRIKEQKIQLSEKDAVIEKRDQEIEILKKQLDSQKQESKYSTEDYEELKAELEDYRQHKKGLTPRQTAILGYKLAEHLGVLPSNKQDLAYPLSKISGWGKRSLEQKICGYFDDTEEKEIADIFGDKFPQIAKIIYGKWESTQVP